MGIVKFGQKTYTIDGIPDGLTLIKEDELGRLREQSDAFHELHARLPLGTDESKITESLEKGKRYDALAKERDELKKSGKDLEGKLKSREDIPEDYNRERWDKYVTTEKRAIRQEKLDKLTEEALVKAEKEAGQKFLLTPGSLIRRRSTLLIWMQRTLGTSCIRFLMTAIRHKWNL